MGFYIEALREFRDILGNEASIDGDTKIKTMCKVSKLLVYMENNLEAWNTLG